MLLSSSAAALAADTTRLLQLPAPPLTDRANPSFEVFYRLCQWITGREALNESVARRLYPIFLDEPWGPVHISKAYLAIQTVLAQRRTATSVAESIVYGVLEGGERWFALHVLTTWYLGIYYHEQRPNQRVAYEHALMWDAVEGLTAIPGLGEYAPGYWADPPSPVGNGK